MWARRKFFSRNSWSEGHVIQGEVESERGACREKKGSHEDVLVLSAQNLGDKQHAIMKARFGSSCRSIRTLSDVQSHQVGRRTTIALMTKRDASNDSISKAPANRYRAQEFAHWQRFGSVPKISPLDAAAAVYDEHRSEVIREDKNGLDASPRAGNRSQMERRAPNERLQNWRRDSAALADKDRDLDMRSTGHGRVREPCDYKACSASLSSCSGRAHVLNAFEEGGASFEHFLKACREDNNDQVPFLKIAVDSVSRTVDFFAENPTSKEGRCNKDWDAFEGEPLCCSIERYITRMGKYCKTSPANVMIGLMYIYRLRESDLSIEISWTNAQRLLLTAIMLATKVYDDVFFSNSCWASLGDLTLQEMNNLELILLKRLDYSCTVSREDYDAFLVHLEHSEILLQGDSAEYRRTLPHVLPKPRMRPSATAAKGSCSRSPSKVLQGAVSDVLMSTGSDQHEGKSRSASLQQEKEGALIQVSSAKSRSFESAHTRISDNTSGGTHPRISDNTSGGTHPRISDNTSGGTDPDANSRESSPTREWRLPNVVRKHSNFDSQFSGSALGQILGYSAIGFGMKGHDVPDQLYENASSTKPTFAHARKPGPARNRIKSLCQWQTSFQERRPMVDFTPA